MHFSYSPSPRPVTTSAFHPWKTSGRSASGDDADPRFRPIAAVDGGGDSLLMKGTILSIATGSAALAACVPAKNSVDVDTSGSPNVSGVVVLCDRETRLTARGDHLTAGVPITCEGCGEVRLRSGDGASATCQIGYVTPGAVQEFYFVLQRGECIPVRTEVQ